MYFVSDLLARRPDEVLGAYAKDRATRITVGAVLRRREGMGAEVLILRRVPSDEYGGIEELPSGGVEDGETLGEAVLRETLEETGITVGKGGTFLFDFVYPSTRGVTAQLNFLFDVPADSRVRIASTEHDSYRWLALAHLTESDLSPHVKRGVHASLRGSAAPD